MHPVLNKLTKSVALILYHVDKIHPVQNQIWSKMFIRRSTSSWSRHGRARAPRPPRSSSRSATARPLHTACTTQRHEPREGPARVGARQPSVGRHGRVLPERQAPSVCQCLEFMYETHKFLCMVNSKEFSLITSKYLVNFFLYHRSRGIHVQNFSQLADS